jgi:putative ABC transport system permease protein
MLQDLRYGLRTLRKSPGFILTVICTLALGMGANTAIFSLISGVLLRPLPFVDSDRLVQLNEFDLQNGIGAVSYADLEAWRTQSSSFDGMIAYGNISKDLQSADNPERIATLRSEPGLFRLLGVQPMIGRAFRDDDQPDVVVLSAGFWRRRFNSDPSCIGRKITLDGEPYTVIGVMPERFHFPYRGSFTDRGLSIELWIPWAVPLQWAHDRNYRVDFIVARLKSATSLDVARRDLSMIANRVPDRHVETNQARSAVITPLSDVVVGSVRPALLTLLGAVGAVLLIACANVMNLLLARAAGRTHEIAIRVALGATRGRVIQQLLTESVLMSAAGGAAGLIIALFSSDFLQGFASSRIPRSSEIAFDWRVFSFLFVVSIGTGILFGFLPALSASKLDVQRGLKKAGGSRLIGYGSPGWSGRRLRDTLVITEIAITFVLVVGAGVLLRAFLRLQGTPTGFAPDNVLTLHMTVSPKEYEARGSCARYLSELESRVSKIPGVRAAGFIQFLPLQNWGWRGNFSIVDRPSRTEAERPQAELRYVSAGFFAALGVPIRRGRVFNSHDTSDTQTVIVINEALAHRYFPNQDPVGQRTDRGAIIGVVSDIRESGLDRPAAPQIYCSFAQNLAATSEAGVSLVLRARTRPESLVPALRDTIHQTNPSQVVFNAKTMTQIITESLADLNLYLWLIGLFAAVALLLAIAGIYGVVSYAVAGRTQEFAIRLALGADRHQISNLVLRHGSMLVACGLAAGAIGALLLARTLKNLVSSVTSPHPATLVLVGIVLAIVALAACIIPARCATQVDPNIALKYE